MKIAARFCFLLMCGALPFVFPLQGVASGTDGLPATAFSTLPDTNRIRLSPNGDKIIYYKNVENNTVLVSYNIETMEMKTLFAADNVKYKLRTADWVNNDYVFFIIMARNKSFSSPVYYPKHLIRKADASEKYKALIKPGGAAMRIGIYSRDIISLLPDDDDHILMAMDDKKTGFDTVYKVNIHTGDLEAVQPYMLNVYGWAADRQGRVRAGVKYIKNSSISILVYDLSEKKWNEILKKEILPDTDIEDIDRVRPIGFGKDPDILYVRADHNGHDAIFKADVSKPNASMELIAKDDNYDITGSLIYSNKKGDVVGINHEEAEGGRIYWDKEYRRLQASIDNALPDTTNYLVDFSNDEQKYIVYSTSSKQPGIYLLGDRGKNKITLIAHTYPQLEGKLQGSKKITFTEHDGEPIEAYLTLPADYKPGTPCPAVIIPGCESIMKDQGDFDSRAEFFASKGIIVFRPNYYNPVYSYKNYIKKVENDFGPAMEYDLTDSVNWLIEQKLADPERIAIAGGGYSGYVSLMSAIKTPDLFRCAISYAGVSDLPAFIGGSSRVPDYLTLLKEAGTDRKTVKALSPVSNVDKIDIPILLVHGDKDTSVPVQQSREMAKKLKEKKKVYTYLELEDGDHGLSLQKSRHMFFKAMDEFLDKYLLDN